MEYLFAILFLVCFSSLTYASSEGLISHKSPYSVTATMDRLAAVLRGQRYQNICPQR